MIILEAYLITSLACSLFYVVSQYDRTEKHETLRNRIDDHRARDSGMGRTTTLRIKPKRHGGPWRPGDV
jgi:hypothetical protein